QAVRDPARLLAHMARLGLRVNLKKSHLEPAQWVTYLGVDLDSATMKAHLSSSRVGDILDSLVPFRGGMVVSYMQVLHLVGRLTADVHMLTHTTHTLICLLQCYFSCFVSFLFTKGTVIVY
ncbi:uncharacterized protein LOC121624267, partial [Scomber scombrus]